jgi:hypothetical protein
LLEDYADTGERIRFFKSSIDKIDTQIVELNIRLNMLKPHANYDPKRTQQILDRRERKARKHGVSSQESARV